MKILSCGFQLAREIKGLRCLWVLLHDQKLCLVSLSKICVSSCSDQNSLRSVFLLLKCNKVVNIIHSVCSVCWFMNICIMCSFIGISSNYIVEYILEVIFKPQYYEFIQNLNEHRERNWGRKNTSWGPEIRHWNRLHVVKETQKLTRLRENFKGEGEQVWRENELIEIVNALS